MKKIRAVYGFSSLLSLSIGIVIYLLFRDLNNMLLLNWIPKLKFTETVFIQLTPSIFSYFLKFNLPDMLWFLSAILFFRFLWFYNMKVQRVYIYCLYGIGIILETSQLSEKVPGTFDWLDLLFMGMGAVGEGLLYNIFVRRRFV